MTSSVLLSVLYSNFKTLRHRLSSALDEHQAMGAFLFLPEGYTGVATFSQLKYSFLPLDRLREYLRAGGQSDNGLDSVLYDFDFDEEFLVMIVEHIDGDPSKQAVSVHKMTRAGMN